MVYNVVHKGILTLPPRSSCGFFLYEYTAYLDVTWEFPVTVYKRDYKTISYRDTEYMQLLSDNDGRYPNANCAYSICNKYFYVTYGRQYFYFVNWSRDEHKSISYELRDLSGRYFSVGWVAFSLSIISILNFL